MIGWVGSRCTDKFDWGSFASWRTSVISWAQAIGNCSSSCARSHSIHCTIRKIIILIAAPWQQEFAKRGFCLQWCTLTGKNVGAQAGVVTVVYCLGNVFLNQSVIKAMFLLALEGEPWEDISPCRAAWLQSPPFQCLGLRFRPRLGLLDDSYFFLIAVSSKLISQLHLIHVTCSVACLSDIHD